MYTFPCVIFAGGKSSRMKEDKSLLPFASYKTLTHYQYDRLSKLFTTVYITCKTCSKFDFDANFIQEEEPTFAPTIGFLSTLNTINNDRFFVISVDTPFISEKEIAHIVAADTPTSDATLAQTKDKIQPLCGIYHKSILPLFEEAVKNNDHKLGKLLHKAKTTSVIFQESSPFFNLNHPHEYQEALKIVNTSLL